MHTQTRMYGQAHLATQTHTDSPTQTLFQPQVSQDGRFTLTPWVTKGKTSGLSVP